MNGTSPSLVRLRTNVIAAAAEQELSPMTKMSHHVHLFGVSRALTVSVLASTLALASCGNRDQENQEQAASQRVPFAAFNDDATSDVLMRHTSGALAVWLINGDATTRQGIGELDASVNVLGLGDFDGD